MKTKPVYYGSPYLKELECTVLSVENKGNLSSVILDSTIFYPVGGGQPSDRGKVGLAHVETVRIVDGEIVHQVKGNVNEGETVKAELDWDWRLKHMRIHTAGHLLHDVLLTMYPDLVPVTEKNRLLNILELFPSRKKRLSSKKSMRCCNKIFLW